MVSQIVIWLIFYVCSFFPDSKDTKKTAAKGPPPVATMSSILWYLVLTTLILYIIVEVEIWRAQLRLQQDPEKTGFISQPPRIDYRHDGTVQRVWRRRGAVSGVAGGGDRAVGEDGIASELRRLGYVLITPGGNLPYGKEVHDLEAVSRGLRRHQEVVPDIPEGGNGGAEAALMRKKTQ
jgi:hypothetical protein